MSEFSEKLRRRRVDKRRAAMEAQDAAARARIGDLLCIEPVLDMVDKLHQERVVFPAGPVPTGDSIRQRLGSLSLPLAVAFTIDVTGDMQIYVRVLPTALHSCRIVLSLCSFGVPSREVATNDMAVIADWLLDVVADHEVRPAPLSDVGHPPPAPRRPPEQSQDEAHRRRVIDLS